MKKRKDNVNILILGPSFNVLGGVANHYKGLSPYWKNPVRYMPIGKRISIPASLTFLPDIIHLLLLLVFTKIDVVIVNPSMKKWPLHRDCLFTFFSLIFNKKLVTMFHGWDDELAEYLIRKRPWWFLHSFGKSCFVYVLYSHFKKQLRKIGIKAPVLLTTTKVSDDLIEGFDPQKRKGEINELLFLARADVKKGILIVIKAYALLKYKYPNLRLSVCGVGPALGEAKELAKKLKLSDITFYGNVRGKKKIKRFVEANLYILPSYGEGMAASVLEAMAFSLPVISRPVGGIVDFWQEGKMGFLTESLYPEDYASLIDKLILNPSLVKAISIFNHNYAVKHFLASKVTNKFENDIERYCK